MPNTATVSFKLPPDRHAALEALAGGRNRPLSEVVCEAVEWAPELERRARLLKELLARDARRAA